MKNAILVLLISGLGTFVAAEDPAVPVEAPVPVCAPQTETAEPMQGCTEHLSRVGDGYENAWKEWNTFARSSSNRLKVVMEKEEGAKKKIQENAAQINTLKFKKSRADKGRIKDLEKENKSLWKTLKGIEGEKSRLCREISKEGAQKHDALSDSLSALWKEARGALR